MTVTAFEVWAVEDRKTNPLWEGYDDELWPPGPKNVTWKATVVCNPPQFLGNKGMFVVYRDWIKEHGFNAQYDHQLCVWYFELPEEGVMFDLTFGYATQP